MPKVSVGLACPLCDAEGKGYDLYQNTPTPMVLCESGNPDHRWNDTNVLRAMNPRKLHMAPKPDILQSNHVNLTLSVPAHTAEALKTKFGDRLSTSLTSVLQACAEPRMTILGAADLQRFEDKLGPNITSAAELFGRVFALTEEKKAAQAELEVLLRRMNVKRGGLEIQLELGEWLGKAMQMAAESGQDAGEFLSNYVRNSLENDWITVSG